MSTIETIPLLLDTDPGIDDAIALYALLAVPAVDLVAVSTVFGNAGVAQTTANAISLLARAGREDVPVYAGAAMPLGGVEPLGAADVHGVDGLGDAGLTAAPHTASALLEGASAADAMIQLSHRYTGTLRIVAIGPLTNLALALQKDPTLVQRVHSVSIMGGAALAPGNATAAAEANFLSDPEAAAIVLEAAWPTVVAPLDLTHTHPYLERHRAQLVASERAEAQAVGRMLPVYFEFYTTQAGAEGIYLHDAIAALLAAEVIVVSDARRVAASVSTSEGIARGALIADLRPGVKSPTSWDGASTIVFAVDRPVADVVQELLLRGPASAPNGV